MKTSTNFFTLIELFVNPVNSLLHCLPRCVRREQPNTSLFLSGKRAASEVSRPSRWSGLVESLKNTSLFLKEKGGAGERGNFFSREKKFPSKG